MTWDANIERMDRAAQKVLGGETIMYAPAVGSPTYPVGIFSNAYVHIDNGTGIVTVGPSIMLRISDLPGEPLDDALPRLTIRTKTYEPRDFLPDGQGSLRLLLNEVA